MDPQYSYTLQIFSWRGGGERPSSPGEAKKKQYDERRRPADNYSPGDLVLVYKSTRKVGLRGDFNLQPRNNWRPPKC